MALDVRYSRPSTPKGSTCACAIRPPGFDGARRARRASGSPSPTGARHRAKRPLTVCAAVRRVHAAADRHESRRRSRSVAAAARGQPAWQSRRGAACCSMTDGRAARRAGGGCVEDRRGGRANAARAGALAGLDEGDRRALTALRAVGRRGRPRSVLEDTPSGDRADRRRPPTCHPARRPEAVRERLAQSVQALTTSSRGLDESRLHQEGRSCCS